HTGIVFDRNVEGQTLTFGVFGELWLGSMIMYDQETMSHWSHLHGEAKRGPLVGRKLHMVPSLVTNWETWRSTFPESTIVIIDKTLPRYQRPILDHTSQFVLGIAAEGQPAAWSFDQLQAQPCRNTQIGAKAVMVVLDPKSGTAQIFQRQIHGRELSFRVVG